MKYFFTLLFLLSLSIPMFAQMNSEKMLYLEKAEKYHRMKRTGVSLTLAGSVLWVAGIVTLVNATTTTVSNGYGPSQTTTTGNAEAGLAAYLVGTGCIGAGIPLWIVGGVSEGRYRRKFNAVSASANVNPHGAGLTLRYRF
jgi:hypothetical protein